MTRCFATARKHAMRVAALLSVLILLASALPLYAISFYNHPYYDDFGFSARSHSAWTETGSIRQVLEAAWESAKETRNTWQGTYTGTLLSNVQPGIFSERLYFIGTFVILTAFLGCFWFFLNTVFGKRGFGLATSETVVLCCLTLSLMLQLMPDTGEAFFWFNGGIGNVFIYALLALAAALLVILYQTKSTAGAALVTALLSVLMVLLGGGSYGGGLFGLCALALATAWAFLKRCPRKWLFFGLWLLFLGCFLYSVSAPGNGVRAGVIGYHASPVKAVAQALYYGTALMGSYLRLPLLGVTALLLPFFYRAVQKSAMSFTHPWLILGLLACLYCAQLVPPLYGGVFIGGGRIVDTYWISFVVLWLVYAFYLCGFVARRVLLLQGTQANVVRRALVITGCCCLILGCLGFKGPNDTLYGAQNLAGNSAAISLFNGEAAAYDRQMTARETLLNDSDQPIITLAPLTAVPKVFMDDLLAPGALYDARPSLMLYYCKEAILIQGEEEKGE